MGSGEGLYSSYIVLQRKIRAAENELMELKKGIEFRGWDPEEIRKTGNAILEMEMEPPKLEDSLDQHKRQVT